MNREDRIRERAHRIWEEEGRPTGKHHEHWHRATHEIENELRHGGDRAGNPQTAGRRSGTGQTASGQSVSSGLVGADDGDTSGIPDAMDVDPLDVAGTPGEAGENRPSTGRSKLVGT